MLKRYNKNPILTREDIPEIAPDLVNVTSVFNPGAIKYQDKILLMLRVQNRARETYFLMAESKDGVQFQISPKLIRFKGLEKIQQKIYHCYDARITFLDGIYYIMFALDMENACFLGLAKTNDFEEFEFLGIISTEDNRNGVLFPEKVHGKYLRLDRPNKLQLINGPTSGNAIYLSESDDLLNWKTVNIVIDGSNHFWDERIGAGSPPIKTEKGWLQIYHGIATHFGSGNIYQAGVMLLDLENPDVIIGRGRFNILEPREMYEMVGQVPNVVFPSGAVVEELDNDGFATLHSRVLVYYGAADTCVGLATSTIEELIEDAMM